MKNTHKKLRNGAFSSMLPKTLKMLIKTAKKSNKTKTTTHFNHIKINK